jgi:acetylornithine deacetylase/succinyl-diaminopimelate desuccinylase-like protein
MAGPKAPATGDERGEANGSTPVGRGSGADGTPLGAPRGAGAAKVGDAVAAAAAADFQGTIDRLKEYLSYPAISCDPAHAKDVRALAERVARDLTALGLDRARVCDVPGALPIVAAEWLKAGPDKPTVLVYGHLDLQPVKGEKWDTSPHEATIRGDRMYARGAADDMGGWVSHLAAVKAWLETTGGLPCNLKLIVEGEEEIGSPNLEKFMDAFPDVFDADVMVLTDCENPSTDVPGLTVSLRGLLELELACEALEADVHSGLWGGMVPDVAMALFKLIARLADDEGRMQVGRVDVPEARREAGRNIDLPDEVIRRGAHLIDGVDPLPLRGRSAAEWMWWQPSVTVVATTLPTLEHKKNALRQKATAILSVRVAPGQKPAEMVDELRRVLLSDVPAGVKASLTERGTPSESWLYTPKGPAFAAADRAYEKAWGKKLVQVGVGGSIPFVALFGRRFGDLPLILNGVMDPETTAHGPNESLHLGVFRKAIAANVHLYEELGALGKP